MNKETHFPVGAEVPSDAHLVLLCLDYLMDLRRNNGADVLNGKKHLDADSISLAVYALMRSIRRPNYLAHRSNENLMDSIDMAKINDEVLGPSSTFQRPRDMGYNDLHPSNLYRFYDVKGLAGGPEKGPMLLPYIVEAGLKHTSARCRLEAEKDIVKSTHFELYIQSVTNRGFFNDLTNRGKRKDPHEEEERRARKSHVYKEKYRKVIAKYREKLAMNVDYGSTDIFMLSPPNSPPSSYDRSCSTPPRSCHTVSNESPLSPLTPNTIETSFSSKSPRTPKAPPQSPRTPTQKALSLRMSMSRAPLQETISVRTSFTPSSSSSSSSSSTKALPTSATSNAPTLVRSTSFTRVRSAASTNVRSTSSTPVKTKPSTQVNFPSSVHSGSASSITARSVSSIYSRSACSTPMRSALLTNMEFAASRSISKTMEALPQSPGKMARQGGGKFPIESRLDVSNRSKSSSKASRMGYESKNVAKYITLDQPNATKPKPTLHFQQALETVTITGKPNDPVGYPPIKTPEHPGQMEPSPTNHRALSPDIEVRVKALSLYELYLVSSMSSGLEVNAGSFHSIATPKGRRRKSEYEKKIEEQRQWACPASLVLPDIGDSQMEEVMPARTDRPKSINTRTAKEKLTTPKIPKVNDSAKHMIVEATSGRVSDTVVRNHGVGLHPPSPVARVWREKNTLEQHKLRYEDTGPLLTSEEMLPPRRSPALKKVCSQDGRSWISDPNNSSKSTQDKEDTTKLKETNSSFKEKASIFHSSSGTKASFGKRMTPNSPMAELKIDPFRITPPKFLGTSRLFIARIGADPKPEGDKFPGGYRLLSPRGIGSPRAGLRLSPPNFNSIPINQAC